MKFKVACIQTSSGENPDKNISNLEKLFNRAFKKKPDLICLPECVSLLTDSNKILIKYDRRDCNKFIKYISFKAVKYSCYILIGSVAYKKKNNKFYNRSIMIGPSGKMLAHYDKINLFDVSLSKQEKYFESDIYDPGNKMSYFKLPWGKIGFTICYDLRFPILFKKLLKKRSSFLFNSGNIYGYNWERPLGVAVEGKSNRKWLLYFCASSMWK